MSVLAVFAVVLLLTPVPVAGEAYYAYVLNRLWAPGGMDIDCRAGGGASGTESVLPLGHMASGDSLSLGVELVMDPAETGPGCALCSWAYAGNFASDVPLLDSAWPEARAGWCRDWERACLVVFEDDKVYVETANGGRRVLGDLPVKRCNRHWWLFSTGCSYPEHPHPYVGHVLSNVFEYFFS